MPGPRDASGLVAPGALTVGIDAAPPPPLHIGDPHAPDFCGFEVDLMKALAGDLGVAVRYRVVLWRDMFQELEQRRLDLVCTAATISSDRAARVAFSAPYLDIQLAIVTRTDRSIGTVGDLRGTHVGVRAATTAAEFVWSHVQPRRITLYDMNTEVYASLVSGELDAAIDDSPIASWFVRARPDLRIASVIPGTDAKYALVLPRDSTDLLEAIDDSLNRIRRDGRYEEMYARWLGDVDRREGHDIV